MKLILPIIVVSQFFCTSLWFAGNSIIADLAKDLNLDPHFLAHLTSAIQFGFITGTFVFAIFTIADRFSPSFVFFSSAILAGLFNLGISFNTIDPSEILLFRFLTGFFLAGIYPVGMKIVSDYYQTGLGKSLGFLVGALVVGTAFPHLLKNFSSGFSWKYVLYTTTLFSFIGGLSVLLFVPNGPYRKSAQKIKLTEFMKSFKNPNFRSVSFGYFGHMWELYTFWAFVPVMITSFNKYYPAINLNVSLLSFFIIASGALACVFSGMLSQHFGTKKIASIALFISCLCCLVSPFFLFSNSATQFIVFLFIWSLVVIADSPLFSTLVAQNAAEDSKGTSLTIVNCIGFSITIISIQLITFLSNKINSQYIYMTLAVGPIFGLIALMKNKIITTKLPFMKRQVLPFFVSLLLLIPTCFVTAQTSKDQATEQKINAIVKQLTLEEKIAMLHANGIFGTAGVPRLNIPGLMTDDGPLGVRDDVLEGWGSANLTTDSATFFPNGSALAATWNPALAYQYGHAIGGEARARKKYVLLAPAFNIARTPLNGRTYEYLSEDPYLNAKLAVQSVKGIQSQNIAACVKHYALNNQEIERGKVSVEIDERALQEIYLPAFKATITEGNAWTIMSAYNKLRGVYCSENEYLLKTILKGQWDFKGIVISDWGGTHSTVLAANNGLDLEMGSNPPYNTYYFADKLLKAVKEGKVSVQTIDEKVSRILWVMYHTTMSENPPTGSINTAAHSKTAYDIAAESIVLLKNEKQILPLNTAKIKSVAVIGDNAIHTFHLGGFGAGVKAKYEVTALKGLENKLDKNTTIKFAQGYRALVKSKENVNAIETSKADPALISEAVALAKSSELTILFVGGNRDYESESRDRPDLSLPFGEQQLVDAVLAANSNTIIVVVGGAPYDINKIKQQSSTIVWSWYNGSENGNALADVLTGKVNPSGKLPFTFPADLKQSPAHALNAYPGDSVVTYKEGILVGYRWFDTKKITPLYPFGYGLSYTSFEYSGLKTNKPSYAGNETITATLNIANTGNYTGKEIVQLYASKQNSKIERADKELKAFTKVLINKGGKAEVKLTIPVKDLAYYDTKTDKWIVESGGYKILVGSSSAQINQTATITIQ